MPALTWLPEALADLERLRGPLTGASPEATARRAAAIVAASDDLVAHPGLGRPVNDGWREWLFGDGVLRYRVGPQGAVVVSRVLWLSSSWLRRILFELRRTGAAEIRHPGVWEIDWHRSGDQTAWKNRILAAAASRLGGVALILDPSEAGWCPIPWTEVGDAPEKGGRVIALGLKERTADEIGALASWLDDHCWALLGFEREEGVQGCHSRFPTGPLMVEGMYPETVRGTRDAGASVLLCGGFDGDDWTVCLPE